MWPNTGLHFSTCTIEHDRLYSDSVHGHYDQEPGVFWVSLTLTIAVNDGRDILVNNLDSKDVCVPLSL